MDTSRWTRWITIAAVVLLAGIAAIVSYSHMYELALQHGEPRWRATVFPLSVDGMVIASSMTLLNDARQGRRGGLLPWTLLVIGSAASLAANIAVAEPSAWSWIIHAWPSVALIGAYELLMRQFRANAACVRNEYADDGNGRYREPWPGATHLVGRQRRQGDSAPSSGGRDPRRRDGKGRGSGCDVTWCRGFSGPDGGMAVGVGESARGRFLADRSGGGGTVRSESALGEVGQTARTTRAVRLCGRVNKFLGTKCPLVTADLAGLASRGAGGELLEESATG